MDQKKEVLIVVSKVKKFIKEKYGMNFSASCEPVLSDEVRKLVDRAVVSASTDGRKTVMDRDFK